LTQTLSESLLVSKETPLYAEELNTIHENLDETGWSVIKPVFSLLVNTGLPFTKRLNERMPEQRMRRIEEKSDELDPVIFRIYH
jgi:hypothetical protein